MFLSLTRLLLFNCLIFLAAGPRAETVTIESLRVWAAPDSTRVVFDVSAPVKYQVFSLESPDRMVIDIKHARLKKRPVQPGAEDHYLRQVRAAARNGRDLRVVLDLKQAALHQSFQLKPNQYYGHRLVIDLHGGKTGAGATPAKPAGGPVRPRDVIIAIDAGHGGEDPGAIGPGGTYEKDVVLQISKTLARAINRERGMRAVLIREGDYYMSLRKRILSARRHKADLFLSIHADAFPNRKVQGASVYTLSRRGASSEAARWLAERENAADLVGGVSLDDKDDVLASVLLDLSQTASLEASIDVADRVLKGLQRVGKVHKKRVQSAGFAVLKSPDIPSILIETAFISNPSEEKKLLSHKHRGNLAGAIVAGLRGYFRDFAPAGTLLAARRHTIARGETLSAIARRYRVSPSALKAYNALRGDRIQAGQTISIPASGT